MPGFYGKFIHSDRMTMAYWNITQGALLPEHSHPHEQVVNLLKGEFELVIDGERRKLYASSVVVIPSGVLYPSLLRRIHFSSNQHFILYNHYFYRVFYHNRNLAIVHI